MSRWIKLPIGLAAALLAGWLSFGPLGRGEAFAARIEADIRRMLTTIETPGPIGVQVERAPLARVVTLTGRLGQYEREQLLIRGETGLNGLVASRPGVGGVRWANEPAGRVVPMLAELLAMAALAWAVGLGLGWLLSRRKRREGYL
ncbi:MAG TPA: hypothetical protein VEX35_07640 [Allosphingosinicella sp.]|nr:hypothetical protein [Allosphingosinicella sp.]